MGRGKISLITRVVPKEILEEIRGPVATVHPFKTDDEAVKLGNQTPYGLGGYVYNKDESHAMDLARKRTQMESKSMALACSS